ncbi:HpcH/HpaI aldolase/citrate lyase family protein [Parablautia muri]|uniref:CoA ester lyase n=1 Tax=Parablautia muri TaxID=2320879 RepID=A0A9X5BD07_9FIRM|nr:CoA ester lyase [Parablautia muri]NBJ91363.1 CoA ester lyase [Parablautia muri]
MLRSFLFVPAKRHMLSKIKTFGADAYIIDLEDSIEIENKEKALNQTEIFLDEYSNNSQFFVRLNKESYDNEVKRLVRFSNVGFMLPKFDNIDFYDAFAHIWKERTVIAIIETPIGIVNIKKIANCKWINIMAFGAEDYTSITNMDNRPELLMYQKSRLVTYAKAYGKYVLDTPCFCLDDENTAIEEFKMAARMGFDGKLAITPKHIEYINKIFNLGKNNHEDIIEIINRFEKTGEAVQVIDGKVYENMHINKLKKQLDL